ncbi:hypothetical protein DB29_01975 [Shouchella clausii]|nr:hypothetical protein DB29_01975 [Shouchella clausii]
MRKQELLEVVGKVGKTTQVESANSLFSCFRNIEAKRLSTV